MRQSNNKIFVNLFDEHRSCIYIHTLEERNLTKTRKQKQKYTWEELQSIWHTVASEGFILYNPFVQNTPVEGHGVLHLFHWCNSASSRGLRGVFQSVFFVIRGWFHHRFRKPDLFLCLVISGTCKGKSHGDFKINIYCKQDQPGDAWKSEKRAHIPPISDSIFFMKSERRRLWSCSAIRTALPETANTAMNPTPIPAEPSMFHPFFFFFPPNLDQRLWNGSSSNTKRELVKIWKSHKHTKRRGREDDEEEWEREKW